MITRATLSTIEQGLPKYRSMLAGNTAYSPVAFESIATVTPSNGSTSASFTSIPQTYKHLQIRGICRDTGGSGVQSWIIQFNSDTGANYTYHLMYGDGSTGSGIGTGATGQTYGLIPNCSAGSDVGANIYGASIVSILDYTSTTTNKVVRSLTGMNRNTTASYVNIGSSMWLNTSAISTITLKPGNTGFASGTTFALYGIKG